VSAFLVVSIDCECDKGAAWRCQRPLSFVGVTEGIGARLHPLFVRHAAKPTYLLSAEVMRDAASVDALRGLSGDHELGAHLHGEYAEPGAFEPETTDAFQRDYPPDVERAKLVYLTELFTTTFARRPTSFRAGRFGIGESSLGILESLGYTVDSSVTPHMDWSSKGSAGLSFAGAPTQPYRPDHARPSRPGGRGILEVPVTIRPAALARVPVVGKLVEPRWLRPSRGTGQALIEVAKDEIADAERAQPGAPVVLNAMFHNVEVIPGASPYAANEREAQAILERLAMLLAFARAENIRVVGLSDVPELLAHHDARA
jgi:hypothetical protein